MSDEKTTESIDYSLKTTGDEAVSNLLKVVAKVFGVTRKQLLSRSRTSEVADARLTCYLLLRYHFELSWPNIADIFDRKHPTVISGVNNIRKRLAKESELKQLIVQAENQLF